MQLWVMKHIIRISVAFHLYSRKWNKSISSYNSSVDAYKNTK